MPETYEGIEDMRGAGEFEMDRYAVPTYYVPETGRQIIEANEC